MTQYGVTIEDGAYRCYETEDGIHKRLFGPRFGGPRLAGQYADLAAGKPIAPTSSGGHQPAVHEDRVGVAGALHGSPDDSPLGRG